MKFIKQKLEKIDDLFGQVGASYVCGCFSDKALMRFTLIMSLILSTTVYAASGLKGGVQSPAECSKSAMVWLSLDKDDYKERLLLMHTEVPVGGSFQFYLKPGNYQLRASDEQGCEYYTKVKISNSVSSIDIKMEKK